MRAAAFRGFLLVAISLAVYVPATGGGFFWDDESYILENAAVRAPDGVITIWRDVEASPQYYPLVFTTFWLEHRLWGLEAGGYHVVNVLLHALNVLLLWLVLRRLAVPGAWLAAALFAVHPVHVESVAWITERKDLLSTAFSLLAALAWLRFSESGRWRTYFWVVIFFACALLSKTIACTLPLSLALVTWWKNPDGWRRRVFWLVPLLLLGVALGTVTVWREHVATYEDVIVAPLASLDRLLVAGRAVWFYLSKLVWPATLTPIYPRWQIDAADPWLYAFPLAAAFSLWGLWAARARFGRGPVVAAAFFVITLAPTLGIIPFGFLRLSFVADHFQYLASAGPIALAAALAARHARRLPLAVLSAAVLVLLSVLTWRQAGLYADAETLWQYNLAYNPTSATVRSNVGALLQQDDDLAGAAEQLREAVRLQPEYLQAQYNLGTVLGKLGETSAATEHLRAALRIKPDFAPAHYSLGVLLMRPATLAEATQHLEEAVRLKPDYAEAQYNLGIVRAAQGRFDEAAGCFAKAVQLQPASAEAHNNLGAMLFRLGRLDEAIEQYRETIALKPEHTRAHYNLGLAFARQGRFNDAVQQLTEAVRLQPDYADARRDLAAVLEQQGKVDAAIDEYSAVLRIQPGDPRSVEGLQRAMAAR